MSRESPNQPASGEPAPGDLLAVARLRRPRGLRGEIHLEPLTPHALDFEQEFTGREFHLRRGDRLAGRARIAELRPYQDHYLCFIENYESREAAETLSNAELCLPRAELPPLPEGWLWESDLEGMEVIDLRRGPVGQAVRFDILGGQSSLVVRKPDGAEFSIPMAKALLPKIDPTAKKIDADLPLDYPGLDAPA